MPQGKVTDAFLNFIDTHRTYDTIPPEVIEFAKVMLLDAVSNTLGGIASDKGKIGVQFANVTGGVPESTVLGVGTKVSAATAAFANGELQNGLDYDPVPHIPPIVVPPVMAMAEARKATGRELLTALCVGSEIARRLSTVLMQAMTRTLVETGKTPDVFGNSNEHIIGAAVGCGMLMGLDREKMGQAIGLSAYLCSLPICRDWESTMPKSMIKYVPAAWIAHSAVCAAQLAELGYTGNPYTLDSEYGFPAIYCRVPNIWDPDKCIEGIGEKWLFPQMNIKPYPACRFLHSNLDCFYKLLDKYHFNPEEITEVRCNSAAFVAHPDQMSVTTQVDGQFSGPYVMALAAYNYQAGPAWQNKQALTDERIHAFMKKVRMIVDPLHYEKRKKDPMSWYARVEVDARGETFTESVEYSTGTNVPGYALTVDDVVKRFHVCGSVILPDEKLDKAIDQILHMEQVDDLQDLLKNLTL